MDYSKTDSCQIDWGSTPDNVFHEIGEAMEELVKRVESEDEINAFSVKNIRPSGNKEAVKLKSVRLTSKSAIIDWDNRNGRGRVFNAVFMDASGEIQLTGFNAAVDRFYELLTVGGVYDLENFCIQKARKEFNQLSHPFEIVLGKDSTVRESPPGNPPPPLFMLEIIQFSELASKPDGCTVDLLGICTTYKAIQTVLAKDSNKELIKRDIMLVDYTGVEIIVSVWNDFAKSFSPTTFPLILCVKGAKVTSFRQQKCIATTPSSQIMINPECIEASNLRTWYLREGFRNTHIRYMNRPIKDNLPSLLIAEINNQECNMDGFSFSCLATVLELRTDNALFPACRRCKRKVVSLEDAESKDTGEIKMMKCGTCDLSLPPTEVTTRLIIRVKFGDCSGSAWAKVFLEECEVLFGESSASLILSYSKNKAKFIRMVESLRFKRYNVTFYAKMSNKHKNCISICCADIAEIDLASQSMQMIREIIG